jgi:hypothetical protein
VAEGHRQGVGRKARQYERRTLAGTQHMARCNLRRHALFCCVLHSCGLRGSHLSDAFISPISGSANERPSTNPAHELLPDRADIYCTVPSDKCSTCWPAIPHLSCLRCPAAVVSPWISYESTVWLELRAHKRRGERGKGLRSAARRGDRRGQPPRADPAPRGRDELELAQARGAVKLYFGSTSDSSQAAPQEHE